MLDGTGRHSALHPNGSGSIVAGEYGRALEDYLRCVRRDQLFVGSTAILGREPMTLLGELWRFLGVDDSHVPPNLGVHYQERGIGRRISLLATLPRVVKGAPALGHAWNVLPDGSRGRTRASGSSRIAPTRAPAAERAIEGRPDPAVLKRLRVHYASDTALLERLVGPVPSVTE